MLGKLHTRITFHTRFLSEFTKTKTKALAPTIGLSKRRLVKNNMGTNLEHLDQEQLKFMQDEHCILVNEEDEQIGHESKHFCHLMTNIDKGVALHRAFSVFFFNTKGELLLQQRAGHKITFPLFWTNTCCSHPLYGIESEMKSAKDTLGSDLGVCHAAKRKLEHELGIEQSKINVEEFTYFTRILYKASYDEKWGEHEIDYVLFYQSKDDSQYPLDKFNKNEVEDVKFVDQEGLKKMMNDSSLKITPWFKLIVNQFLFKWWDSLLEGKLTPNKDERQKIYKL